MTIHIHNWTDGYLALRDRAFVARGSIELDSGPRWPRTTGADAIAIAAVFDPAMQAHGTPGVLSRWRLVLDDLRRAALPAHDDPYSENRSFWNSLEGAAVFLDDARIASPPSTGWAALLAEVGTHLARNAGPSGAVPFGPFASVATYDDLYLAEYKLLRDQRGADTLAPPTGSGGITKPIPRTTNADVLQLASYWGTQLGAAKRIMGTDTITAKWHAAMSDVDQLAKPGKAGDVYAKNNEFWRTLGDVAIHVAVAVEAPSTWGLVVDSVKDSVSHLPETLGHAAGTTVHAAESVGEGLLGLLKKPLYLGAGLVGLYLLTRNGHRED
jgi:hypothetical protein